VRVEKPLLPEAPRAVVALLAGYRLPACGDVSALDAARTRAAEAAMAKFAKDRDHQTVHIILACDSFLSSRQRERRWESAQSVLQMATLEASRVDLYVATLAAQPYDPAMRTWRELLHRYSAVLTTFVTSPNIPLLRLNVKGCQNDLVAVAASLRARADGEDRELRRAEQRVRATIEQALGLS